MSSLSSDGFELIPRVLNASEVGRLQNAFGEIAIAGQRNLAANPEVIRIAQSPWLHEITRPFLSSDARAVRALLFNKSSAANWLVPWHQDLTIAVRERIDLPGWGPWSIKGGVSHVQPPVDLLERMLTVRIHLDAVGECNGPLRIVPGTHQLGKLSPAATGAVQCARGEVTCTAEPGDVLLMRPLVLHASGKATSPTRRRVLHIELADFPLPGGLSWCESA